MSGVHNRERIGSHFSSRICMQSYAERDVLRQFSPFTPSEIRTYQSNYTYDSNFGNSNILVWVNFATKQQNSLLM